MSLLQKFSAVQIDPSKTVLKGEDQIYCNRLETHYKTAFQFHKTHLEFFTINREENEFLNFIGLAEDIESSVESLNKSFIEMVVYHFKNKYKISLVASEIQTKIFPEEKWERKWDRDNKEIVTQDELEKKQISLNSIMVHIQDRTGN
jgi:hypothetical protein